MPPVGALDRLPSEFSGGMRQRAMIARALICGPSLLIADEPTTALDVTIQGQILELLRGLQRDLGMAILFITHDLGIVAQMADHVAVMYSGRIVESGPVRDIFRRPAHPYTRALLEAVPRLGDIDRNRRIRPISGSVPNIFDAPPGCRFHPRCPVAVLPRCAELQPPRTAAAITGGMRPRRGGFGVTTATPLAPAAAKILPDAPPDGEKPVGALSDPHQGVFGQNPPVM